MCVCCKEYEHHTRILNSANHKQNVILTMVSTTTSYKKRNIACKRADNAHLCDINRYVLLLKKGGQEHGLRNMTGIPVLH